MDQTGPQLNFGAVHSVSIFIDLILVTLVIFFRRHEAVPTYLPFVVRGYVMQRSRFIKFL